MSGIDVLKNFIEAIETQQFAEARQHLSGNFIMTGWTAQPLNKNQFLDLIISLKKSMPELAFQMQNFQEDYQVAQSDRVDADMRVSGKQASSFHFSPYDIACIQKGRMVSLPQEHVSCTIMGENIESMLVAPVLGGGLEGIVTQLGEESISKSSDDQLDKEQDELQESQESMTDKQLKKYNKQSNLYDPQGKSYTPSRDDPDYAPQVDAYAIAQGKQDNPAAPLFDNMQEQREFTSREPNRQKPNDE